MPDAEPRTRNTEFHEKTPAGSGMTAILVPLIIGGALAAAALVMWNSRYTKLRQSESTRIEEEIRADLKSAYQELRDNRPDAALKIIARAKEKITLLHVVWSADYVDLRLALLLVEGEADFQIDPRGRAAQSEGKFDAALSLMTLASGEVWEFGVLGRARSRLEQKKHREANEDLTLLLERNPSFGAAYYYRAKAREGLGDGTGAAEDAKRAENLASWPPLRERK